MSGILQFTLGLTTGGFVSNLDRASSKLKGFVAGIIGIGSITDGVWRAIEKGAALKDLSEQTGETVGNLYRMQRALGAVGIDGQEAGNMLFMLNKALGGVSETGEPTAFVFNQLGLNIRELKTLNGPAALAAIGAQLNKLDNASATAAAGRIFGRYSAREFLQLARNTDQFTRSLAGSRMQAELFNRYAGTFHNLEVTLKALKENSNAIFQGLAAGVAPALLNITKSLSQLNFAKLGQGIGTYITALTQAFREGKFSELVADSLKVGFEAVVDFAPALFEKIGMILIRAFETPLTWIQARMEYSITNALLGKQSSTAIHAFLNNYASLLGIKFGDMVLGKEKGPTFEEIYAERKAEGVKFNLGSGESGIGDINADANTRNQEALNRFRKKWDPYWAKISNYADRAPKAEETGGAGRLSEVLGAGYAPNRTELEKMGLVFRGGVTTDHAATTARNTGRTVQLLEKMLSQGRLPLSVPQFTNS